MIFPDFAKFEERAKVFFKDKALLKQAFLHRSYLNENPGIGLEHNERLEFLGDAVLELAVTDHLFRKYPDETEGGLTSYRSALVNANIISEAASQLGMNDYLLLSKGEARDTGKARQYILANTFEAFLGAIYLDQGYKTAEDFVARALFARLDEIVTHKLFKDAKSLIQEFSQERENLTPAYKVLRESGPDHDKHFTVGVFLGTELVAEGSGKSKQEAEQEAARAGLLARGWRD